MIFCSMVLMLLSRGRRRLLRLSGQPNLLAKSRQAVSKHACKNRVIISRSGSTGAHRLLAGDEIRLIRVGVVAQFEVAAAKHRLVGAFQRPSRSFPALQSPAGLRASIVSWRSGTPTIFMVWPVTVRAWLPCPRPEIRYALVHQRCVRTRLIRSTFGTFHGTWSGLALPRID